VTTRPTSIPIVLVLILLAASACTKQVTEPTEPVLPRALTEQEEGLITSGNLFGLKLFRAVSIADSGKNLFLSPISVSMALGMTLNGAAGETRTGMEQALELAGLTEAEINASYHSLIDLLSGLDRKVIFEIANSIWYREGFPVAPAFVTLNQTFFDAVVRALDFADPGAAGTINGWVDSKTHGKIPEVIESPIEPAVVMFLINAIYFKGDWTWQFEADKTEDRTFHLSGGGSVEVPSMQLAGDLPVFTDEELTAVDLPYGNGFYSMTVLLPGEETDLETMIAGLDAARWQGIVAGLAEHAVGLLQLPKFKLEYKIQLKEVLSALGMATAFSPGQADFSRMVTSPLDLFISQVIHKTFVEVDEEGTEAAAVTVVVVELTSVGPDQKLNIVVDRPFVFVLRERLSGTILFIGKYLGPSA
jgi:serine protease inhibitor